MTFPSQQCIKEPHSDEYEKQTQAHKNKTKQPQYGETSYRKISPDMSSGGVKR